MKLHSNNWPSTDKASRYKLFSETVLELVHLSSWESYKSHTLSTLMKVQELIKSIEKVRKKEIGKPALEPQLQELRHSIENDIVYEKIVSEKSIPASMFSFQLKEPIEKIYTNASMLLNLVSPEYQSYCEEEIIRLCSEEGSKNDIIKISKLYVAHINNRGYSKEYIYSIVNSIFYQQNIGRCTPKLLKRFYDHFPNKNRSFDILFSGSADYIKFMTTQFGLDRYFSVGDINNIPKGVIPSTFGEGKKKRIVCVPNVSKSDAYSAARTAELLFSLSRSFLYLHPENVNAKLDTLAYVIDRKSKKITHVELDKGFTPRRENMSKSENASSISGLTRYVFASSASHKRVNEGQHRIFSSLNSASLAAKTGDPESRLLSIWSAFEALLPDPLKDGEGTVRIVHFSSLITPCAVFDYLPTTFYECYRNCSKEFGKPFRDVVSRDGIGETDVEKFASIFIADQGVKNSLCATVSSSPLMLMRFHRLEKLLLSPKNANKYLETHHDRVTWQINRIYRERNNIVHKAKVSPFLDGLTENAYAYYRSVILSLERAYSKYEISHPDQGLEIVSALYSEYKDNLKNISEKPKISTAERNSKFINYMFSGCLRA